MVLLDFSRRMTLALAVMGWRMESLWYLSAAAGVGASLPPMSPCRLLCVLV